jgi:glycosyltransferase involved in cell wall biosynthesis
MEHFVLRLAAVQQAAGHSVSILALRGGPLQAAAEQLGLPCSVLGGSRAVFRAIEAALLLARLRPDIVHAHNQTSLHYAVLGKRVSGARVVMTNHGQGLGSSRTPSAKEWRATDAVVAVSRAVGERMDAAGARSKLTVIYNGVNVTACGRSRSDTRRELQIDEARVVGALVARIDGLKGHDTLLHALARLQLEEARVTILIAGDGTERANMERLAYDLGLTTAMVRFLGFRTDVADLLAASDFFVLPSLTEGLPLSILEAMTHGLPTVATAVGGIPELILHGQHGLLVPVQSPVELAEAIAQIAANPEERRALGRSAYTRVRETFSFEQMTELYDDLYFRLCPAKRRDA